MVVIIWFLCGLLLVGRRCCVGRIVVLGRIIWRKICFMYLVCVLFMDLLSSFWRIFMRFFWWGSFWIVFWFLFSVMSIVRRRSW